MLKITNLTYKHPNTNNSYNYSIEVKKGEIVAILGESGSGKSTLLDLIAGFLTPLGGKIELDGDEFSHRAIECRPISILFQHHNLFEHLSVEKNILLGISKRLKDSKSDIKRVEEILQKMGLEEHQNSLALSLSGGQQQRVALARVLLREQVILLLDEPFTGLDTKSRLEMLELVKRITIEKNLCTIMVTHEIQDADLIASRIYRVKNFGLQEA